MKQYGILLAIILVCSFSLYSQSDISRYEEDIITNFIQQAHLFPQEKIHLHFDKSNYISGERIWFKAYLVNSILHEPMPLSKYVYVELINPLNIPVKRVKIKNTNDAYHGYLDIPFNLPEGNYTLRAYTHFMNNQGEAYFFRSPVFISNPEVLKYEIVPTYRTLAENQLEISLDIKKKRENKVLQTKDFTINHNHIPVSNLKLVDESIIRFTIHVEENVPVQLLSIEYDTYRKYIYIPSAENEFDVTFYPEGGCMIAGIPSRIAFKALQADGSPVFVKGQLVDGQNNIITSFSTFHDGMGDFLFAPAPNEKYMAICETESGFIKSFALPEAHLNGVTLKVQDKDDLFSLSLNKTPEIENGFYLVAHSRGYPVYVGEINTRTQSLSFPKADLPAGIIHFLLLDKNYNTLSERLVFSHTDQLLPIHAQTNKPDYTTREFVKLNIHIPVEGVEDTAQLSVSVTNDADTDVTKSLSILANFLLKSDLRGTISDPDYYFRTTGTETQKALDLLMLVHGWRRYDIPSLLKGNFTEPEEALEIGQEIAGNLQTLVRKRPVANSEVSIISTQHTFYEQTTTNAAGEFFLQNFDLPDSTVYIVQALTPNGSSSLEIIVNETTYPEITIVPLPDCNSHFINRNTIEKSMQKLILENGMRVINLDDVEVVAQKKEVQTGYMSSLADASFTLKEIEEIDATCLQELFRRIPGLYVFEDNLYLRGRNSIYGNSKVALVIDGVFIDGDFDLHTVQMPDVARVDIFKTGSVVIFGPRGGSGVLSITTKRGDFTLPENPRYNIKRISPLGFQKPVEFYSPQYDTPEKRNNPLPDYRTTIHWEPDVRPNQQGEAEIEFYTADHPSTYTINIEGITSSGRIIKETEKIIIK